MPFAYQPSAELLLAFGFAAHRSPPGQVRHSRPSACGQETMVLYSDGEITLLETVEGQLLYSFQGRLASEAELRVLLRQVNWPAELSLTVSQLPAVMTDVYLRSLGFAPLRGDAPASRSPFADAWRYQHDHLAQDGAALFLEHPLGINRCRLSALVAPLHRQDVFADLPLQDQPALEAAIGAFFAAHGGMGPLVATGSADQFRPYRRER